MTPYEINIILHIYARPGPFSDSGISVDAPIFEGTVSKLQKYHLISPSETTENGFVVDSRGAAYVDFLTKMPLPNLVTEPKWEIPSNG